MSDDWYVYVMHNKLSPEVQVYTGATNRPAHRVRAHRGEVVGGAQTTKRWGKDNAQMAMLIGPFPPTLQVTSKQAALSFEKKMKITKSGAGLSGRVRTLCKLLNSQNGRVTDRVRLALYERPLTVRVSMSRTNFLLRRELKKAKKQQQQEHEPLPASAMFAFEHVF